MNFIKWPLNSYGTIIGTVRNYDADGNDTGVRNIATCGIYFVVRNKWSYLVDSSILFKKSVGSNLTVGTGTLGLFNVMIQSSDVNKNPNEYVFETFINEVGTNFVEGTTQLKSIGSGVFEILSGAKYGTT